jgi:1-acyl-sn-glycerol-3-phosphate acyltransferase
VSTRPPLLYRLTRLICGLAGRLLFDARLTGTPPLGGGWIASGLPHRNWVEPFLMLYLLPATPRLVVLGSGQAAMRSPWRRWLVRRIGGVVPVWPGARAAEFTRHLAAAKGALEAGAVFVIFPETGAASRPGELRRLSGSVAQFARHTSAPVVPIVFGGTHELWLRRRIEVRVLPPIEPPPADAERAALAAWMDEFRRACAAGAADAHEAAESAAARWRIGRWLTGHYPRTQ